MIKTLADNSVDACVTDPPYALVSIQKRFGKPGSAEAKDRDGLYKRASAGFMGQQWDTGEVAFDPAFWAEVLLQNYTSVEHGSNVVKVHIWKMRAKLKGRAVEFVNHRGVGYSMRPSRGVRV